MKLIGFRKQVKKSIWKLFCVRINSQFSKKSRLLGTNTLVLGGFLAFLMINPGGKPAKITRLPTKTPTPVRERIDTFYRRPINSFHHQVSPDALTITPTPTPTPTFHLPNTSFIEGISGHRQSMPLSCESRSAVDWAAYFGKTIDEVRFFNGLPVHDNPDKGFVGDVYGSWGQIPPHPYGVHAKPIAQRLREFELKAKSVKGMTYQELKAEIASGQPVIVWVVGHVNRGTPVPYTASGGAETVVAKFEHTVIVIGYTEHKITLLDGAKVYTRYKGEFMKSWNVLGNQAVIWID